MIQIAEVPIPKAVFTSASEIPFANAVESVDPPEFPKAENALIIPITVPKRPINVDTEASVAMIVKFFSNIGNSNEVASSTSLLKEANFCSLSKDLSPVNCLYFSLQKVLRFQQILFAYYMKQLQLQHHPYPKMLESNERMHLHHPFLLLFQ